MRFRLLATHIINGATLGIGTILGSQPGDVPIPPNYVPTTLMEGLDAESRQAVAAAVDRYKREEGVGLGYSPMRPAYPNFGMGFVPEPEALADDELRAYKAVAASMKDDDLSKRITEYEDTLAKVKEAVDMHNSRERALEDREASLREREVAIGGRENAAEAKQRNAEAAIEATVEHEREVNDRAEALERSAAKEHAALVARSKKLDEWTASAQAKIEASQASLDTREEGLNKKQEFIEGIARGLHERFEFGKSPALSVMEKKRKNV